MRKWRKMTWAIWAWCALILVWAIGGGSSAASDCADEKGSEFLSAADAQSACEAGTGIGIAIVLFIGFCGFIFLSLIWFMTRSKKRDCPRCGDGVKKGVLLCGSCGFDFNSLGAPAAVAPSTVAAAPGRAEPVMMSSAPPNQRKF